MNSDKFCGNCGEQIMVDFKFCPHCGTKTNNKIVFEGSWLEGLATGLWFYIIIDGLADIFFRSR